MTNNISFKKLKVKRNFTALVTKHSYLEGAGKKQYRLSI